MNWLWPQSSDLIDEDLTNGRCLRAEGGREGGRKAGGSRIDWNWAPFSKLELWNRVEKRPRRGEAKATNETAKINKQMQLVSFWAAVWFHFGWNEPNWWHWSDLGVGHCQSADSSWNHLMKCFNLNGEKLKAKRAKIKTKSRRQIKTWKDGISLIKRKPCEKKASVCPHHWPNQRVASLILFVSELASMSLRCLLSGKWRLGSCA